MPLDELIASMPPDEREYLIARFPDEASGLEPTYELKYIDRLIGYSWPRSQIDALIAKGLMERVTPEHPLFRLTPAGVEAARALREVGAALGALPPT